MGKLAILFKIFQENNIISRSDVPKEFNDYIDTLKDDSTKVERDLIVSQYLNNIEVLVYHFSLEIQEIGDKLSKDVIERMNEIFNKLSYDNHEIIIRSLDINMKRVFKYSQITYGEESNCREYPITMDLLKTRLERIGERCNRRVKIHCPSNEEIFFKLGGLDVIKIDIRRHRFEYNLEYIDYRKQSDDSNLLKGFYIGIEDDIMNIILALVGWEKIFISKKFVEDDTIEPIRYF